MVLGCGRRTWKEYLLGVSERIHLFVSLPENTIRNFRGRAVPSWECLFPAGDVHEHVATVWYSCSVWLIGAPWEGWMYIGYTRRACLTHEYRLVRYMNFKSIHVWMIFSFLVWLNEKIFWRNFSIPCLSNRWKMSHRTFLKGSRKIKIHENPPPGLENPWLQGGWRSQILLVKGK